MTRTVLVLVTDQTNTPVADAIVIAVLDRYDVDVVTGQWISPVQHQYRTDENGEVTMSLWPNTAGERNSRYKVTAMTPNGRILFDVIATVPDVDGSLLSEIADSVSLDAELNPTNQSISYVQAQVMIADAIADLKRKRIPSRGVLLDPYGAYTIAQSDEDVILRINGSEPPIEPETHTVVPIYVPQLQEGTFIDVINDDGAYVKLVLVAGQGVIMISGALSGIEQSVIIPQYKKVRLYWAASGRVHVDGEVAISDVVPLIASIVEVEASGTTMIIQFSAEVESADLAAGLSVSRYLGGDGELVSVTVVSAEVGVDPSQVVITTEQIYDNDSVRLSYDSTAGDIASGPFQLQDITNMFVNNNSTVVAP